MVWKWIFEVGWEKETEEKKNLLCFSCVIKFPIFSLSAPCRAYTSKNNLIESLFSRFLVCSVFCCCFIVVIVDVGHTSTLAVIATSNGRKTFPVAFFSFSHFSLFSVETTEPMDKIAHTLKSKEREQTFNISN